MSSPGKQSIGKWTRFKRLILYRIIIDAMFSVGSRKAPRTIGYARAKALHHTFKERSGYGFDEKSKKVRASNRLKGLRDIVPLDEVKSIAELGGGDGQLALLLSRQGYQVSIVDIADWRDQEVKAHPVPFVQIDNSASCNLPSKSIDFFISYNTIEHVPDPASSLREMMRITKPGGWIYLHFAPLYNSPWGLHVFSAYRGPYPQFTFDQPTLNRFIQQNFIHDLGKSMEKPQYVNGWSYSQYEDLFSQLKKKVELKLIRSIRNFEEVAFIIRHIACFWGRKLSYRELTTEGLQVLIKVP